MPLGNRLTLTAAGVAALALVATPLPALADETETATGDLTVTRFDDRYADGLFDVTKTAASGDKDRLNTSLPAQLIDVDGTRHYKSADADGRYRFTDVPVGPATLYLAYPNGPSGEVLFDATGAATASDIVRLGSADYYGQQAVLDLMIDEDGEERLIGMSALRLVANVQFADGTPVAGAAVELGSQADWYAATEYTFRAGTYEAFGNPSGYIRHLPGELGVRVTPPAGYGIGEVTAADNNAFTVIERDGAYFFSSTEVWNYFWNPAFTVTLEELPDTTRPTTTLVAPTTTGPMQQLSIQVDAADDRGLARIVANVYKNGTLVKSTQSAVADGAMNGTHAATVSLADGAYTIKYNAQDLAGNISQTRTVPVVIDGTAPTATVKTGESFTVGGDGVYEMVSFKLFDAQKIDRVTINGTEKNLTDNTWSDVNFIKPGTFGAREGENTLVVFDVAGNTQTITFTLG